MFNEELLTIVENRCGAFWTGSVSTEMIDKLCKDLNVSLSQSYIAFLERFGEGGISGDYIYGIDDDGYSSVGNMTKKFREDKNIPLKWVVLEERGSSWERYLVCLDTSRMQDGECPIIKYDLDDETVEDLFDNFYELFNHNLQVSFDTM